MFGGNGTIMAISIASVYSYQALTAKHFCCTTITLSFKFSHQMEPHIMDGFYSSIIGGV